MLSLTIAGGIFLLDYKIKEHIDSTRLQGSKEEVLGGRLLLRNCHNKDKILGKVKIGRENCQELAAAGMGCVAGEYKYKRSTYHRPFIFHEFPHQKEYCLISSFLSNCSNIFMTLLALFRCSRLFAC